MNGRGPKLERLQVETFVIPTSSPESDGTIQWDKTTMVLVEAFAGGQSGLGWTYASRASAEVIHEVLEKVVQGGDVFCTGELWLKMVERCRNLGRPGAAMMAISAVDVALWDIKAKLVGLPLSSLLGKVRARAPIYGSGGFTSYDEEQLKDQLGGWVKEGIPRVKMKVGRDPEADPLRVAWARQAIGAEAQLFVDANGAYNRQQAARLAIDFAKQGVVWLEEPVSSDNLDGLRWVRDHVPAGMQVAAGEYGFDPWYFNAMLAARSVDVLQADATRCGGVTGWLRAAAVADAYQVALSGHCAPNLHAHPACAAPRLQHLEYFYDHVRIEHMFFDGVLEPQDGALVPDPSRPGMGLELKRRDAERYAA